MRERYLSGLLRRLLEASDKPAKVISAEVGIPYSTLMNQLNGDIPNAKFGADDLLHLCQSLGSIAPVEYLAGAMGYRLQRIDAHPDGRNLDHECTQATIAVAALFKGVEQGLSSAETMPLLRAAIKELEDVHLRQLEEELAMEMAGRSSDMKVVG